MVDGEPQTLNTESGGLLDYYVIQAYYSPGDTFDTRFNKLLAKFGSIEDEAAILRKLFGVKTSKDINRTEDRSLQLETV